MTDENMPRLREWATSKGRSIIFLDGPYETNLNRYKKLPPVERAVAWEFMLREKGVKGAIFLLCWLGNFHNGCIFHASPQFPQLQCWYESMGMQAANAFFERQAFRVYAEVVSIVHNGGPIIDPEVREFVENGQRILAQ